MGKQIIADNLTLGTQLGHSATEINGVSEDYKGPVQIGVKISFKGVAATALS